MITRRSFNSGVSAVLVTAAVGPPVAAKAAYTGPDIILIRFGGGNQC